MKRAWGYGCFAVLAVGLATTGVPQADGQKAMQISDKAGNMSVSGAAKLRWERPVGQTRWKLIARSAPSSKIEARWKLEGIRLITSQLDAVVDRVAGKDTLVTAEMAGGVRSEFTRPSTNAASKTPQTATVDAESADYVQARNEITVKGGIVLDRKDPGANETMHATGSTGVIEVSPLGSKGNVLKVATLTGPVIMKMTGMRAESGKKAEPFVIDGRGDKMVFRDDEHTVVLSGNVKITGDHPGLGGEISGVSKVTIQFTAGGDIVSIDMDGDPGRTVISSKKKGGGR